jgi:trans-aconitate 2-methyltransferase
LRDIAAALFPDRFDTGHFEAPVQTPQAYWQLLSPMGDVQAWETEYLQRLDPAEGIHPVHAFTQSTAMRPFVEKLIEDEARSFAAAYDQAVHSAYPLLPDGSCLMPFRRVFFTLKV